MDTMYRCCAGLDVHKETVAACVRRVDSAGRVTREVRTFGTMTGELLKLSDWLMAEGVEAAAMESTGVFWKPIWNILVRLAAADPGQRPAHQERARPEDGCEGLRLDRPVAPVRAASAELRAGSPAARVA